MENMNCLKFFKYDIYIVYFILYLNCNNFSTVSMLSDSPQYLSKSAKNLTRAGGSNQWTTTQTSQRKRKRRKNRNKHRGKKRKGK